MCCVPPSTRLSELSVHDTNDGYNNVQLHHLSTIVTYSTARHCARYITSALASYTALVGVVPASTPHPKTALSMDDTATHHPLEVCIASNPEALRECYQVLAQSHGMDLKMYEAAVQTMLRHGFHVAYVRCQEQQAIVCVATYIILPRLGGAQLQVHDFATDVHHRGHGYGKTLLDWIIAKADSARCSEVVMHTTCEAHANRQQAFLLCKGFTLDGFRFTFRFDDER